jgi:hypothetical protein
MPRSSSHRVTAHETPAATVPAPAREYLTIKAAAAACGWKRANSFRERWLATREDAVMMGLWYDERGCAYVDADAVEVAAQKIATERAERVPNWRIKNLGAYARPRPQSAKASLRPKKGKRRLRARADSRVAPLTPASAAGRVHLAHPARPRAEDP